VYHVTLSNGESYTVTTEEHHDDHTDTSFARHLLDVIKSAIGGVISGTVVRFMHKGRA
jgi:hypothetical protein